LLPAKTSIRVLQVGRHGYRAESSDPAVLPVTEADPILALGRLIESAPGRFGLKLSIEYGRVADLPRRPEPSHPANPRVDPISEASLAAAWSTIDDETA